MAIKLNTIALFALGLLMILAIPSIPGSFAIPEFWITLLNYIGLYAIVTLGLVLLTGVAGLTSFGQAAFVGIGAYCTAYLSATAGFSPWLGLAAGLCLTTLVAFGIGAITMRLSGHFLPLGTIAWGLSLYYLYGNSDALGKFDGIGGIPDLSLLGIVFDGPRSMFVLIWLTLLICMVGLSNLLSSRIGRAIRALKGGIGMAEAMGVNTPWAKIIIFVIAADLAAVSGFLYAHMQRSVNPTPFGLNYGIEYLFMAVVGGANYVIGAVLGAGTLTILKDLLQRVLPWFSQSSGSYEGIVFGILIIFVLHYARDGLWPLLRKVIPTQQRHLAIGHSKSFPARKNELTDGALLEVQNISRRFGGLIAVNDISFSLNAGEIVTLIGPNGAGKTTTFNLISRATDLSSGKVWFRGERIETIGMREVVKRGLARTFQHVRIIREMSVLENVALGAHIRGRAGFWRSAARLNAREEASILAEAAKQLRRVGLESSMHMPAENLALGQQRILEIARALCSDPLLLLLDEPAAGLREHEKRALAALLKELKQEGLTILLVEHDMEFVMNLTDRLIVINFGSKIAEGSPSQVTKEKAVIDAYLGAEI